MCFFWRKEKSNSIWKRKYQGIFVKFDFSYKYDDFQVVNQVHAFVFPLSLELVNVKDIQIDSHIIIKYPSPQKSVVHSICSFGLEQNQNADDYASEDKELILATIAGSPKSGNTSFLNAIWKLQDALPFGNIETRLERHIPNQFLKR